MRERGSVAGLHLVKIDDVAYQQVLKLNRQAVLMDAAVVGAHGDVDPGIKAPGKDDLKILEARERTGP
ncbi:MAG: hypothetical protein K2W85_01065, partial [Phycisphaerales bacterium]|nr:hypothetical protein [Phycisphaerales bacterium]